MKSFVKKIIRCRVQSTTLCQYLNTSSYSKPITESYLNFMFRELTQDDLYQHPIFTEKNRCQRYLKHLENGHRCYGFFTPDNHIAAYFWLSIGKENQPIPNPAFKYFDWLIAYNEAYIWDCRTIPSFQRKGLYREGIKRLVSLCQQQGIHKIMMSCEPDNFASHRGIISAGFQHKGRTRTLKTNCFKWIHCGHQKPKLLFSSKPVVTGDVFPWV